MAALRAVYKIYGSVSHELPYFMARVSAGKPSSEHDYVESRIDLIRHLVKHPRSTFIVPVDGYSMEGSGIAPGDLLVVDRAAEPNAKSIVIVDVDGELTVKRLSKVGGHLWLVPDNKKHKPVKVRRGQSCTVWGVVVWILKKAG